MQWIRTLACALALGAALGAWAHEVPTDVRIRAFVKPEREQLTVLLRVPLAAMREVDVPTRGGGYLDLARAEPALRTAIALWLTDNLSVLENGAPLPAPRIAAARVSLASDRSFGDFDSAAAHLRAPPLAEPNDLYWNQQLLDVRLEYPIASAASDFALQPRFERLGERVSTTLHFLPPGKPARAFELHGNPGVVQLDPSWHQAAFAFVGMGFMHILEGIDHLLFIACLVIPFRRLRALVIIATAFTIAHSITLGAAAMGFAPQGLWFPPLVETLIAASVFYLAIENIFGARVQLRWLVAFAFGLVHGFGFAFGLRESLQFAGSHLVTALAAFNVGVELGQVAVLIVLVPALDFVLRRVPERIGVIVLSAVIAHTAWHWMLDRGADLRKFGMPTLDAAALATASGWAIALIVLAGFLWFANRWVGRWLSNPTARVSAEPLRDRD